MDINISVILNIHWDGGWLENNVTSEKRDENNPKQRAYWQQIATYFRDFDERLMAEVHFYTPWNFAGLTRDESWGNQFYYWSRDNHATADTAHNPTWGEEETVDALFAAMKRKFVDRGIPVILGEYGAIRRSDLTGDALRVKRELNR